MVNRYKLFLIVACANASIVIASQQPQNPTQKKYLATPKKFVWKLTPEDQDAIDANRYLGTLSPFVAKPIDKQKKEAEEEKAAACVAALQKAMVSADNKSDKK